MADGHELEMQPPRQAGHHVRLLRPRLPRLQRVPDLLGDGMARLGSFSQQSLAGPGALVDRSPMGSPVSDTAHRTSLETASLASRLPGAVRLAGRRVLVVERSLSARMLLAAHLRLLGCVVEVASPGRDMVETIARSPHDVIFVDHLADPGIVALVRSALMARGADERGVRPDRVPIVGIANGPDCDRRADDGGDRLDAVCTRPVEPCELRELLSRLLAPGWSHGVHRDR